MKCAINRVTLLPDGRIRMLHFTLIHYPHRADLSEGIELLKCLSDTFCLEFVSKIRSVLSVILFHKDFSLLGGGEQPGHDLAHAL